MTLLNASDELRRLEALRDLQILDTAPEKGFDDAALLASEICETPIAFINLVDADRHWWKSSIGVIASELPRDGWFCTHTIGSNRLFVVEDAASDEQYAHYPLVCDEPHIRFYAGAPLVTPTAHAVGTLCVADRIPRQLMPDQVSGLSDLARRVMDQMLLRRTAQDPAAQKVQRERFEDALQENNELMRHVFETSEDCITVLDLEANVLWMNARCRQLALLYSGKDVLDLSWLNFWTGEDQWAAEEVLAAARAGGTGRFEASYSPMGGRQQWWSVTLSQIVRSPDKPVRLLSIARDVSELKRSEQMLKHQSLHDSLTGLPNRALVYDRLERCIERAKRNGAFQFAILFLDLNSFKQINDTFGHSVGDSVLAMAAERLSGCLRALDTVSRPVPDGTVGRIGGDEFVVILEETADPQDAVVVANRITAALREPYRINGLQISSGVSIGIAPGTASARAQDLIEAADEAMYRVKPARQPHSRHDSR